MPDALIATNLTRRFAERGISLKASTRGLAKVSFRVPERGCFGFVGPNGAGKTTFIKIALRLIQADSGEVSVLGMRHNDPAWRARVGYLPEQPYFYDHLTPTEYLDLSGRLFGLDARVRRDRSRELLGRLGLERSSHLPLRKFSKGMQQRLGVAQALINDPDLIILDEPMSGLDPIGRRDLRQLFLELRDRGKALFFSSHILSDVEALCDSVAVLVDGRLIAAGPLGEVLRVDTEHMEITLVMPAGSETLLPGVPRVFLGDARHRFDAPSSQVFAILSEAQKAGATVVSVVPVRRSLEEFFVNAASHNAQ